MTKISSKQIAEALRKHSKSSDANDREIYSTQVQEYNHDGDTELLTLNGSPPKAYALKRGDKTVLISGDLTKVKKIEVSDGYNKKVEDRHLFRQKSIMLAEPEYDELLKLQKHIEKRTGYPVTKKAVVIKLVSEALGKLNAIGVPGKEISEPEEI